MTARARERSAQTRAEVEQLLAKMRDANERLLVAAVLAQNESDEAHAQASLAKAEIDRLLNRLDEMAQEAGAREEAYRQLSTRLLTLQDEERRRLALDLHDSTAQRLAALSMNLDVVEGARQALDARARRALAESRTLAEQCSREVRTLAYLLHPPLLDERGLPAAVGWFVEGFTKRSGIEVTLNMHDVGRLPEAIERSLFRVIQESLTNVHRHASTATASITLTATVDEVALDIEDQGRGLRDQAPHPQGTLRPETLGVGIQGMRERTHELGGRFDVAFTDSGTTVCVRVPLNKDAK